jgi:hypothetical protein
MKLFCALLCSLLCASVNPQLHAVKRVYILAMGSGMDQFLADQFTKAGLFEVVTDPKKADAIVTDNVGEPFQRKLNDLYPPPPPPPDATKPAADSAASLDVGDRTAPDPKAEKKGGLGDVDFSGGAARSGSIGRGKGTFFVVDRSSRIVLWSVYERPKDSSPRELSKTAARVVKHLKDDLTEKKPAE